MPFPPYPFNMCGMGYYERLGEILRDRLDSDEDPFAGLAEAAAKRKGGPRGDFAAKGPQRKESPEPKKGPRVAPVPSELIEDFLVLGLRPGEPLEECKDAWKRLIKTHHPDRHQGSDDEKRAAELATINITRSYRRIRLWFETGRVPKE